MAQWAPIPNTGECYWVSDDGRVWSRPRYNVSGGELSAFREGAGYDRVTLYVGGRKQKLSIHRLMLEAFVGNGDGLVSRHLDGDPTNNRLENLAWGTRKDNAQDASEHGVLPGMGKVVCLRGHPFDHDNTRMCSNGRRRCRACHRESERRRRGLVVDVE